jgi:hypothetical protein
MREWSSGGMIIDSENRRCRRVPTFAGRGYYVVSTTDSHIVNLGFLDRNIFFIFFFYMKNSGDLKISIKLCFNLGKTDAIL